MRVNKILHVFFAFSLFSGIADASPVFLLCKSVGDRPHEFAGQAALNLNLLIFPTVDWSEMKHAWVPVEKKLTSTELSVDACGGTMSPRYSTALTFDITSPGTWGQDVVQIPRGAWNAGSESFIGNWHTCLKDGEQGGSWDFPLFCKFVNK